MVREVAPVIESIASSLGLKGQRSGAIATQLAEQALTCLSSDRRWLAVALQDRYAIVEMRPQQDPCLHSQRALLTVAGAQEGITAVRLVTFHNSTHNGLPRTFFLLGTNRGYIHLVDLGGRLLLRERLHDGPCCSITLGGEGNHEDSSNAAITLGFSTALARVEAVQVLALCLNAASLPPGGTLPSGSLHCTKWELPKAAGTRSQAYCLGRAAPSLYDCLAGRSAPPKLHFLTGGRVPAVAVLEAAEAGHAGVLGLVTELATGVSDAARTLVKGRPDGFRAGLGSWLGRLGTGAGEQACGPEIPPPRPGQGCSFAASFDDEPREVVALLPAPRGALAVAADSLGRVLLIDTACMAVVRVWKAYRSAQMAWLLLPQSPQGEEGSRLVLVLYTPKRGLLEIWQPRLGPRMCSWLRGRKGLLLQPGAFASGHGEANRPVFMDWETGAVEDVYLLAADELRV